MNFQSPISNLGKRELDILRNAWRQQAHQGQYGTLENMPPEAIPILEKLAMGQNMPPRGDGSLGAAMAPMRLERDAGTVPRQPLGRIDSPYVDQVMKDIEPYINPMPKPEPKVQFEAYPEPAMAQDAGQPTPAPTGAPTPDANGLGLLGDLTKLKEGSKADKWDVMMTIGSGMLGLSNDPNLQKLGMAGFGQVSDRIEKRGEKMAEAELGNRTVQYLAQKQRNDLATAVKIGAIDPKEAIKLTLAQKELPADVQKYMWLMQNPEAAKYLSGIGAIGGKGTNVNVGGGVTYDVGAIPAGYSLTYDEQGRPTGMELIEGSPQEQAKGAQAAGVVEAGGIVIDNIERLQQIVSNDSILSPIFGVGGLAASYIPGTRRLDAQALADTIKANIGFDQLTQMRQESPTGGALGQVTERELAFLQSVLTNLSFSQSQDQFQQNLQNLRDIYGDIIRKAAAYPNADKYGIKLPAGVSPEAEQDPLRLFK